MLSFFPRDVLDGILELIESISEGFPTYSFIQAYTMKPLHAADLDEEWKNEGI